jgi:hypothetical protein
MNTQVLDFIGTNYAPGRVCLIGSHDPMYELIRIGQSGLTPDKKPSKWNHTFLLGERRGTKGEVFILESDIHFSLKELQFINGPQESKAEKWCLDSLDYACVLGMNLSQLEQQNLVDNGVDLVYDVRYRYAVAELFGTLWAILTKTISRKNIFDKKYAVQCATLVRMCYQAIGKDPLSGMMDDLSNTSPERIYQSSLWTFRKEWQR